MRLNVMRRKDFECSAGERIADPYFGKFPADQLLQIREPVQSFPVDGQILLKNPAVPVLLNECSAAGNGFQNSFPDERFDCILHDGQGDPGFRKQFPRAGQFAAGIQLSALQHAENVASHLCDFIFHIVFALFSFIKL